MKTAPCKWFAPKLGLRWDLDMENRKRSEDDLPDFLASIASEFPGIEWLGC